MDFGYAETLMSVEKSVESSALARLAMYKGEAVLAAKARSKTEWGIELVRW